MTTLARAFVHLLAVFTLVSPSFADSDSVERPNGWLGIFLGASATEPALEPPGVRVRGVIDGGPADEARIRANDSIVAIDGAAVTGPADLMARLRNLEPGSSVKLSVRRGERDLELSTVLGDRPKGPGNWKIVRGRLGIEAIELPPALREHFGAPEDSGILVSKVAEGSPADLSGIRVGDVIYEADGQPVKSARALSEIVTGAGAENTIDVVLARDGARIVVGPQIERAP